MTDFDLLREIGDAVPEPEREVLALGRQRLLEAIAVAENRVRRPRWVVRPRYTLIAATAAVAAAVATIGVPSRRNLFAPVRPQPQTTLAAEVLGRAATAVDSHPSARPAADQWLYLASIDEPLGRSAQRSEEWTQFDGRRDAYMQDGRLVTHVNRTVSPSSGSAIRRYLQDTTPMTAFDALAALPHAPKKLLAAVDRATGPRFEAAGLFGATTTDPAANEFQFLAQLLWDARAAAPASAEAAVYRALATIPGVRVQPGVTDAAGDGVIAVSADGGVFQLLLDPTTYATLGLRVVSSGTEPVLPIPGDKHAPAMAPPAGTVVDSLAWSAVRLVGRPGQR